jgi:hypothetical protein
MEESIVCEFCLGLVVDWGHSHSYTRGIRLPSQLREPERKSLSRSPSRHLDEAIYLNADVCTDEPVE